MKYTKLFCIVLAVIALLGVSTTARESEPQRAQLTQPEPSYTPQEKLPLLHMRYPQVIAWLTLPAVGLDEPVVEAPDDEFYLSHDFTGRETDLGALFLGSGLTLQSPVMLIYGPSNTPGAFFAKLADYRDPEFLAAHSVFTLAVPEGLQQWHMRWSRVVSVEELHALAAEKPASGERLLFLVTQAEGDPGARLVIAAEMKT